MYQRRPLLTTFLLTILFLTYFTPVCTAKNSSAAKGAYPEPLAKAALLMDATSGRVLYQKNAYEQMPPASVTKIMTAMLTAEQGNLNQDVLISKNSAETPESSVWLEEGEILTREQLLYACMLNSANDAAVALAESVSGSIEKFVELMNRRARELDMKDTHFCNPHGLHDTNHYTTAYDLGLLSREALKNPDFCKVVATKTTTIPWTGNDFDRLLVNQNRLLNRYDGTIGLKTGYTKEAGNCVVGAAQKGSLVLIAIALNSPTVYEDLIQMLDYGFSNYNLETIVLNQESATTFSVENGKENTVSVKPVTDLTVAATNQEKNQITYRILPIGQIQAPIQEGQILGTCKIYVSGMEAGSVDLAACSTIDQKPFILNVVKAGLISISKPILTIAGCIFIIRQINIRRYRRRRFKRQVKRF